MTHYALSMFESLASEPTPATSTTVEGMVIERPPHRPLLAALDAVLRHPGAALALTALRWMLDHLLRS